MTHRPTEVTAACSLELRVAQTGDGRTLEGIVVPYGETTYATADPHGEAFQRGAFTRTIAAAQDRPVKLFRNHDHSRAIGLATGWDPDHRKGLWGRFTLRDHPETEDVMAEVREGLLDSFSIGFRPVRTERSPSGVRVITEAALAEVSLLALAAYSGARVLATRGPGSVVPELPPMPVVDLTPVVMPW